MLSLHFPPRDDNEILTKICKIKILKHKNFIEIAKQKWKVQVQNFRGVNSHGGGKVAKNSVISGGKRRRKVPQKGREGRRVNGSPEIVNENSQ